MTATLNDVSKVDNAVAISDFLASEIIDWWSEENDAIFKLESIISFLKSNDFKYWWDTIGLNDDIVTPESAIANYLRLSPAETELFMAGGSELA